MNYFLFLCEVESFALNESIAISGGARVEHLIDPPT